MTLRIHLGEFGAQQKNLRGIIDPPQDDNERPGRSIARLHTAFADVQPDQKFTEREQQRSHQCTDPNIAPANGNAWQKTVDQRKQNSDDSYGNYEIDDM